MIIAEDKNKIMVKGRKRKYADEDDRQTVLIRYRLPKNLFEKIKYLARENLAKPNAIINNILESYHNEILDIWSKEDLENSLDELISEFSSYFKEQCDVFISSGIQSIEEQQMELSKATQFVTSGNEFIDGNIRVREVIFKTIKEYSLIFNRSINAELILRIERNFAKKPFLVEDERSIMKIIIFKVIADGYLDKLKIKL